jgi:hypothetical protein
MYRFDGCKSSVRQLKYRSLFDSKTATATTTRDERNKKINATDVDATGAPEFNIATGLIWTIWGVQATR